jgi:hypothetical protein
MENLLGLLVEVVGVRGASIRVSLFVCPTEPVLTPHDSNSNPRHEEEVKAIRDASTIDNLATCYKCHTNSYDLFKPQEPP